MSLASNLTRFRGAVVRRAIAAALVGTTVAAGLIGTAGPAHASGETDYVLMDTGTIDLGLFTDPFTSQFVAPGAAIRWNANNAAHTYAPSLFGIFSLTNAARICGWIEMRAYKFDGTLLAYASTPGYCPATNSRSLFPADPALPPLRQLDVHKVRVSAIIQIYGSNVVQASHEAYPYD